MTVSVCVLSFFCSSFSVLLFLFFFLSSSFFSFFRSGLFPGLLFYCAHWGLIKKSASRCQERPVFNTPPRPLAFWPWNGNRSDLKIWIGKKDVRLLCLRCWPVNLGFSFFLLFRSRFFYFRRFGARIHLICPLNVVLICFTFCSFFVLFRFFVCFFVRFYVLRFGFRLVFRFFSFFFVFLSLLSSRLSSRHLFYAFPAASAPRALHEHEPSSDFRFRPRNETRNGNELIESVDRFKMDETKSKGNRHDGNC